MIPFATETIVRLRPALVEDERGDLVPSTDADRLVITGCNVQPGAANEEVRLRDTATIRWTVWAPLNADVVYTDLIEYQGITYQINGEPERRKSPTGILDHQVIYLEAWKG